MDKYIGKKLEGRYEIRELVGVGGMANVYKGYDVVEDRTVAIKILRDEFYARYSRTAVILSEPPRLLA